jgi:hypothetical protein
MRILDRAKRTTAALTLLTAPWLVVLGAAVPAHADDPPPAAPDSKSSAPADAPPSGAAPPPVPPVAKPAPVPHLSSPENLPPYTTGTSNGPQDPGRMSYFKEVWHAYQDHDISPRQALVLLAQRPMDADAPPPPGLPADPQAPVPGPAPDSPPSP